MREMSYVGWYDGANQTEPTFDPGAVPCVVCHEPWTEETVRTICVMWEDRGRALGIPAQSLFYRMHRACADSLTDDERTMYDGAVLDKAPYSVPS